jgi:mannose-6-phosphate isomerase class I
MINQTSEGILSQLVSYKTTSKFAILALVLSGRYTLPSFNGHYILIATRNITKLIYKNGSKLIPQGRAVFVSANVGDITAEGNGEIVIAYPFII